MAKPRRRGRVEPVLADLKEKDDAQLKDLLDTLCEEEARVSYRRRILHGQIDILRAELVERLKSKSEDKKEVITSTDIDRLSEILARGMAGLPHKNVIDD